MATSFPKLDVIHVAVTGAAGQIGYALVPLIAQGLMFGPTQKVALHLLDLEVAMKSLTGVRMELLDCALPLLADVVITSDARAAFTGADVAVMCGAFPRKEGMERKDLLTTNAGIFRAQGALLKEVASPHCRVLVVGNPANTNALLLATAAAGGLDPRNVTALTRLDHNRAVGFASAHRGVPTADVVIWGNHSATQVPDAQSLSKAPLSEADVAFFEGEFIPKVQQRGAEVMKLRGFSSALSAAKAIVDHVHDWIVSSNGRVVSMAVQSDGNPYGVPAGLVFSFPVTCEHGNWSIVGGLTIPAGVQRRIDVTTAELVEERTLAGVPNKA